MRCCAGASVVDALSVRCDRFSVQTTKRMQSRLVNESNRVALALCSGPRSRGRLVHDALALQQRAAIEPVAIERVDQTQAARGAIGCTVAGAMRGEQIYRVRDRVASTIRLAAVRPAVHWRTRRASDNAQDGIHATAFLLPQR